MTAQLVAALKTIKTTLKAGDPTNAYVITCQTLLLPDVLRYETSLAGRVQRHEKTQ